MFIYDKKIFDLFSIIVCAFKFNVSTFFLSPIEANFLHKSHSCQYQPSPKYDEAETQLSEGEGRQIYGGPLVEPMPQRVHMPGTILKCVMTVAAKDTLYLSLGKMNIKRGIQIKQNVYFLNIQ